MKIRKIDYYHINLPLKKPYKLSGGRLLFENIDATIVRLETDNGLIGWGEGTPWGNTYLPAFGGGIRAAGDLLAPAILNQNPLEIDKINRIMDITLPGHLYAKSPIDIACWDILSQHSQIPLVHLLGGEESTAMPIASSISTDTPENMLKEIQSYRQSGYFVHSVKVGSDVNDDIDRIRYLSSQKNKGEVLIYDVNRAWLPTQAIEVMNAVKDLTQAKFEQPCETLEQCLTVRQQTFHSISIDERLETTGDMIKICQQNIGEIINLKIGRVGGLTKAKRIKDLALDKGFALLVMETGGSVLADTVAVHLAATIPEQNFIGTWLCQEMLSIDTAINQGARNQNGYAVLPNKIGMGITPNQQTIGKAVKSYG